MTKTKFCSQETYSLVSCQSECGICFLYPFAVNIHHTSYSTKSFELKKKKSPLILGIVISLVGAIYIFLDYLFLAKFLTGQKQTRFCRNLRLVLTGDTFDKHSMSLED